MVTEYSKLKSPINLCVSDNLFFFENSDRDWAGGSVKKALASGV